MREALRAPEALAPTLFIPLFFLVVNVGQAARIFPSGATAFLHGQNYAAFQLPSSLLIAGSFGGAALYLVEEIENGYFDKLRATPIPRTSIVLGRLWSELVKGLVLSAVMILVALPFGVHIRGGALGFLVLVAMIGLWAMVFSGFMLLIALKSRSAAATQSAGLVFFPLLFLTPNFVPRALLTHPMQIAARFNPVTYIMEGARSLILEGFVGSALLRSFGVIAAAAALMLFLCVRVINRYD
jgi:ABC-2 type transport system permease protein